MKKPRSLNYIPHNKWQHIDTNKGEEWDSYLENLSKTVSRACEKFFASRGIVSISFTQTRRPPLEPTP